MPVTDESAAMVGKWGAEDEVFLIVSRVGDRIVFAAPENDTWRIDISDARLDADAICYTKKDFLRSGEDHPFNGVECNIRIRLIDADTMEMKWTTVRSPDPDAVQLVRIE